MKKNFMDSNEDDFDLYRDEKNCRYCGDRTADLDIRFYRCDICGQIMATIGEATNPLICCGQDMTLLEPGTTDAVYEKHVPVYSRSGHKIIVSVGSEAHPMTPEHHIDWICLVTDDGIQWKPLEPEESPIASFRVRLSENVIAIYAYCNLHGLWKCE